MKSFALFVFVTLLLFAVPLSAQVEDFAGTDFSKADSIARLYPGHSLDNLYVLASKLTADVSSPQEKFRAIYTWVCLNIANDYRLFKENARQRKKLTNPVDLKKWNAQFRKVIFESLRTKHSTVCTGYAVLVKDLCRLANIRCEVIDGYGRTLQANIGGPGVANHSWSAVNLSNKWYLCDATWSSGAIDVRNGLFVKHYSDAYFLAKPELFLQNHYPMDSAWMLTDKKISLRQFLDRPITYSIVYNYNAHPVLPETFKVTATKKTPLVFEFTSTRMIAPGELKLTITGGGETTVQSELILLQPGHYRFTHAFPSKGKFVVHITIRGDVVFSYEVSVKGKKA